MKTSKLNVRFPTHIGMRTCLQQYLLSLCVRLHRLLYLRDLTPGYTCLEKRSCPWLHVPPMSILSCGGVVNGNMIINTSALGLWEVEQGLAFSCLGLYLQFMCMLYFWPSHVETAQSSTLFSTGYLYCTLVDVWHHLHCFQTPRIWQHIHMYQHVVWQRANLPLPSLSAKMWQKQSALKVPRPRTVSVLLYRHYFCLIAGWRIFAFNLMRNPQQHQAFR